MECTELRVKRKRYTFWGEEEIKSRLLSYLHGHEVHAEQVQVGKLRQEQPQLAHQLMLLSYTLTGKRSVGAALKHFDHHSNRRLPSRTSEASEVILAHFPRERAVEVYEGRWKTNGGMKGVLTEGLQGRELAEVMRAYRAFFTRRRSDHRPGRLTALLDSAYPDLREEYGIRFSEALAGIKHPESIKTLLRKIYFSGGDLTREGLYDQKDGESLIYRITHDNQRELDLKDKRKKTRWEGHFASRVARHMSLEGLTGPDLLVDFKRRCKEVLDESTGENKTVFMKGNAINPVAEVGHLAEIQFAFLAEIDHHLSLRLFSDNLVLDVQLGRKERKLEDRVEADARLITTRGDVLVEVKSYKRFTKEKAEANFIQQYQATRWQDGKPIVDKIAVILSGIIDQDARTLIEENGWRVIDAEAFSRIYSQALDELVNHEPDFFTRARMPIVDYNILKQINQQVCYSSHLLHRRTAREQRRWASRAIRRAHRSLIHNHVTPGRAIPEFRSLKTFSDFSSEYKGTEQVTCKDALFYDIEYMRENGIVTVIGIGMAYYSEEQDQMVSEVLFARNPYEEEQVVKRFAELASKYKKIVTFNGRSCDIPVLQERIYANRVNFDIRAYEERKDGLEHIDMYHQFYRTYKLPRDHHGYYTGRRLQDFEKRELQVHRQQDVASVLIPQVYRDFLEGKDELLLPNVIHHNHLDVVTLAIMYSRFGDRIHSSE